jgi:hypothetical protein
MATSWSCRQSSELATPNTLTCSFNWRPSPTSERKVHLRKHCAATWSQSYRYCPIRLQEPISQPSPVWPIKTVHFSREGAGSSPSTSCRKEEPSNDGAPVCVRAFDLVTFRYTEPYASSNLSRSASQPSHYVLRSGDRPENPAIFPRFSPERLPVTGLPKPPMWLDAMLPGVM